MSGLRIVIHAVVDLPENYFGYDDLVAYKDFYADLHNDPDLKRAAVAAAKEMIAEDVQGVLAQGNADFFDNLGLLVESAEWVSA